MRTLLPNFVLSLALIGCMEQHDSADKPASEKRVAAHIAAAKQSFSTTVSAAIAGIAAMRLRRFP